MCNGYDCYDDDCDMILVYVTRADGKTAKITLPVYPDEDLWTAIGNEYPKSYDHMDEDSILPLDTDYPFDDWFVPTEDAEFAQWLQGAQ